MDKSVVIIGYSGHAFVVCDIFSSGGRNVIGYCENECKEYNPYKLEFFGRELSVEGLNALKSNAYFIAIGSNRIRKIIQEKLSLEYAILPTNAIHPSAVLSSTVSLGKGVMVAANATINPFAKIGNGVICNTSCVIEHENKIGDFAHIGPGAILCGNVSIGKETFVGANAVVKQGITIGSNVMVGAGAVVIRDIPDNCKIVGNPQRTIK